MNTDFEKLVFVGATDAANGVAGFGPAPAIKETNLFLRSDGTWAAVEGVSAEVAE